MTGPVYAKLQAIVLVIVRSPLRSSFRASNLVCSSLRPEGYHCGICRKSQAAKGPAKLRGIPRAVQTAINDNFSRTTPYIILFLHTRRHHKTIETPPRGPRLTMPRSHHVAIHSPAATAKMRLTDFSNYVLTTVFNGVNNSLLRQLLSCRTTVLSSFMYCTPIARYLAYSPANPTHHALNPHFLHDKQVHVQLLSSQFHSIHPNQNPHFHPVHAYLPPVTRPPTSSSPRSAQWEISGLACARHWLPLLLYGWIPYWRLLYLGFFDFGQSPH